jgi:cation diffusion facilitator CzcD-associated flavoprotein CzcO
LLQDYLRNVARKYNLYKYIRFNTSVEAATWDDSKNRWKVDVTVTGGKDAEFNPAYSIECDFLVSAVGQLNQPRYPDIEGLKNFKGKIMHSARWDWSHSLEGRSVGIIGNGMGSILRLEKETLTKIQALRLLRLSPKSYHKPRP